MKYCLIALMILAPLAARAASPEESYLGVRDRSIEKFNPAGNAGEISERTRKDEERARADLEHQLRSIIGPSHLQGFPGPGKSNIASLFSGDEDFGLLDGLVYASKNDKMHVLVTTRSLLDHWLRAQKDSQSGLEAVPGQIEAALNSDAFYTQALETDAAFSTYATLPVAKPAQATFAVALLGGRSQDIGPLTPAEIVIGVVEAERVFVFNAPADARIKPMPTCMEIWRASERKAKEVLAAYTASDPKDQKLFDEYSRTQENGDEAFRRCYAENANRDPQFAVLTRQAQVLIDLIPPR